MDRSGTQLEKPKLLAHEASWFVHRLHFQSKKKKKKKWAYPKYLPVFVDPLRVGQKGHSYRIHWPRRTHLYLISFALAFDLQDTVTTDHI